MQNVNQKSIFFYLLLGIILIRPSLDIISNVSFQVHPALPSFNINGLFGIIVIAIVLMAFLKDIKKIITTPLFISITIFISLIFISIFYSIETFNSFREFIRLSSIFLLYFLAYQFTQTKEDFWTIFKFILASYLIPLSFGLFQLIFNIGILEPLSSVKSIYGTFAHPNPFAFYTFFILGISIALILSQDRKKVFKKIPYYLIILFIVLSIIALLFAHTRSALASFGIFILVFGFLRHKKILFTGIASFLLIYTFYDFFQQRINDLISLDPYGSIVWRLRLWRDMISLSNWQPWFGYGANTFTELVEFYRGFKWGSLEAHNDYLKLLVENGILGLLAYLSIWTNALIRLLKIFYNSAKSQKSLSLGILIVVFGIAISSFFDNILRETALQWNLWILLGAWLKFQSILVETSRKRKL